MVRAVSASTAGLGDIEAPIDAVWAVLMDVEHYPEWNPFTVSVRTTFELGSPVDMQVALRPGKKTRHQVEYLTSFHPDRYRLSWGVNVGPGWFIKADRWQQLTDLGDGRTRYETSDEFTGAGVGLMLAIMEKKVSRGFHDVARGLKARAESRA
ncbi:MAG: hypothetical protein JWM40_2598 [Frankiales bacterium]|nr:hypothetical protein [Frankiales bacterium]